VIDAGREARIICWPKEWRHLILSSFYRGEFRTKLANRPEGPATVTIGTIVSVCILAVVVSLVVRLFQRSRWTERAHMSEQEERERFMLLVERDLDRVRHYLHSIVILLIYGGLIIIGLLGAITLKLFLG
jgi:hypothetical protein